MHKRVSLAVALIIVWPRLLAAQPQPMTITVDDAVRRALETSHRLGEVKARDEGAQATVAVRRTADKPTISVNGGYTRTNHVDEFGVPVAGGPIRVIYPDIPDNYFTRVALQWPIYSAGRTDALERAAEAEARAVGAEVEVARADLRLEVVRAYWAVATATESARVLRSALERAAAHRNDVRRQFEQGLVPPNDVSSIEAQRSRQQLQLIEAENIRQSMVEDLKRLTGLPPETEISIPPTEPPATVEPGAAGISVQDSIARAFTQRAERQVLSERVAGAQERGRAALAARRPTIAVTGAVDYANPNPRIFPRRDVWRESWDVTVNVNWALWDAGRAKAEAAEAAAAASAIRERLADLDTVIASDVRQRLLDIDSARAAIVAAGDAVRSAEETRRVVAERFTVGVATSTDVLDAQLALLQAELDRTRAVANLHLAEARLDRAVGR